MSRMTGEEFSAVLQLIHPKLSWNYGTSRYVAGVVLRDGSANPVKLLVTSTNSKETLPKLIEKFMEEGVNL